MYYKLTLLSPNYMLNPFLSFSSFPSLNSCHAVQIWTNIPISSNTMGSAVDQLYAWRCWNFMASFQRILWQQLLRYIAVGTVELWWSSMRDLCQDSMIVTCGWMWARFDSKRSPRWTLLTTKTTWKMTMMLKTLKIPLQFTMMMLMMKMTKQQFKYSRGCWCNEVQDCHGKQEQETRTKCLGWSWQNVVKQQWNLGFHMAPGAVVSLQVDYRTHYNPDGLVAIIYDVWPNTGGIKVCCQHGVITHDGSKCVYWVPVEAPVGMFLPLPDK
jgi:hypothetical protein